MRRSRMGYLRGMISACVSIDAVLCLAGYWAHALLLEKRAPFSSIIKKESNKRHLMS